LEKKKESFFGKREPNPSGDWSIVLLEQTPAQEKANS